MTAPKAKPETAIEPRVPPEVLRSQVPDGPIRIPSDRLACAVCGVSSPRPRSTEGLVYRDITASSPAGRPLPSRSVEMTRCHDCARRLDAARALVEQHPKMTARLGPGRDLTVAEGLLAALALLGQPPPSPTITDAALGQHVRHLGTIGLGLAWRLRAEPGLASPYAFASVGLADRQQLRNAYGAMLAERVASTAPPVRLLAPRLGPVEVSFSRVVPRPGGCAVCGTGSVSVPAATVQRLGGPSKAVSTVWRTFTATRESLGGRPSPDRLSGHVCPPCSDALDSVGSVGATLLERSYVEHLAATGRADDVRRVRESGGLVGLVGWAATSLPPNDSRWQHVTLG